ncbi:MAG: hypothetical protein Q8O89_02945 [Nanoarchaeota archaeon]|nr:hypothetical protein [Nanoarchaeota archaeon]
MKQHFKILIIISIFTFLSSLAYAANEKNHLPKLNKQLEELLGNYSQGTIDSNYRVQLILEFKDQSQNKKAHEINEKYFVQEKSYRSKIKDVLHKYNFKIRMNESEEMELFFNNMTHVKKEDKEIIDFNTKEIRVIDLKRKQELKKELTKIIKNKQRSFVKELNEPVLEQGSYYNYLVVEVPIFRAKKLVLDERFSNIYLNAIYTNLITLNESIPSIYANNSLWMSSIGTNINVSIAIVDSGVNWSHNALAYRAGGGYYNFLN